MSISRTSASAPIAERSATTLDGFNVLVNYSWDASAKGSV
jgi:hypothetical protein